MKYNQRMIDQLRAKMPSGMRVEIARQTGVAESTVRDSFITFRMRKSNRVVKLLIYNKAVELLGKVGIEVEQLND